METRKTYRRYTTIVAVLLIYAALIVTLIVWIFFENETASTIDKLQSPPVIILAIVVSVLTFTVSSAVFAAIGKSKNNRALGMPDGSIRALIAFILITLFFILATQIYSKVSEGSVGKLERVSEDDLKQLSIKDIISKEKVDSLKNNIVDTTKKGTASDTTKKGTIPLYTYFYNLSIRIPANSDAADISKTIIASFTALIATICGFYFGSAASKQSSDPKTDPSQSPKITPKSPIPTTGTKGTAMTFEWEVTPAGQLLIAEILPDTSQPVADPLNPLKFTYTPGTTGKVTLKVYLKNSPSVMQEYSITISE